MSIFSILDPVLGPVLDPVLGSVLGPKSSYPLKVHTHWPLVDLWFLDLSDLPITQLLLLSDAESDQRRGVS